MNLHSDDEDYMEGKVTADLSHNNAPNNEIDIGGWAWATNIRDCEIFKFKNIGYQILINWTEAPPSGNNENYFKWQNKLAYLTGSYSVGVSGSSEISVDISNGLASDDEFLFIFAGDYGDTTVVLTC